jgi:glucokinase
MNVRLDELQGRALVGVDVGGTKIAAAVLVEGRLFDPMLEPSSHVDAPTLIDQLVHEVESAIERSPAPVAAVGVGVPSVVEFETGRVRASVNLPLRDVPLRQVLQHRLQLPVFVDNDATCAALSEAHDADGRLEVRDLVMFTVGTGVGGGIVIDGRVYRGATGAAGELGHMILAADLEHGPPDPTGFPQPGSLEALAAGRALDALAAATAAAHPDSALGRAAAAGRAISGPDSVEAARAGDADAIAAIGLLGRRLGIGIANAINVFDPEVVAVGGGVSAAGEMLVGPARETALKFILPGVGTRTEIRLARSGPAAGLRGAALLAGHELLSQS